MKLYDLGILSGYESITVFHAMAHMGMEGLVITSSMEPIVSLGYFQDLKTSINESFIRDKNLLLIRRETGGGTVLLDSNQIFYQLVFGKDDERFPGDTLQLYKMLSQPVIDTYADFGIKVAYREVNDLVTLDRNRKISGEAGGDIGNMKVFVGTIIMDFDCDMMSRVFQVPNEEYRLQLVKILRSNLSSIRQENGSVPERSEIIKSLASNFAKILGPMEPGVPNRGILDKARELEELYTSPDFLSKRGKSSNGIKIAGSTNVYSKVHPTAAGRINTIVEVRENKIGKVCITGDFTFIPMERLSGLEDMLEGLPLNREVLVESVRRFMDENKIDCPGLCPEDFADALGM